MLADACRQRNSKVRFRRYLMVHTDHNCVCPMGAALIPKYGTISARPHADAASRRMGIPRDVAVGFAAGFDGLDPLGDPRAFELGKLFAREWP